MTAVSPALLALADALNQPPEGVVSAAVTLETVPSFYWFGLAITILMGWAASNLETLHSWTEGAEARWKIAGKLALSVFVGLISFAGAISANWGLINALIAAGMAAWTGQPVAKKLFGP